MGGTARAGAREASEATGFFTQQGEEERAAEPEKVDYVEPIAGDEALEMTRRLAREEGIFAGISTGADVVGAHRLADRLGP